MGMPLLMLISTAITVLMHSYRRLIAEVLLSELGLVFGSFFVLFSFFVGVSVSFSNFFCFFFFVICISLRKKKVGTCIKSKQR